jgi:hypothetical protein
MEKLIAALRSYEATHQWWSPETFLQLENKALKKAVEDALQSNYDAIQHLITDGSTKEMDDFHTLLKTETIQMSISTLAVFLNILYSEATDKQTPVSKDVVAWYRSQGWKFPLFPHEAS